MNWQFIESAPLDGTHVLVTETNAVCEARHIVGEGWYVAGNDPTDVWGGPICPTHWMPLPAPPVTG